MCRSKGWAVIAVLALAALTLPLTARRADARTHVIVGIGFGSGPPTYVTPAYAPPPVYYPPPPAYVAPPPVYSYAPPAAVVEPPAVSYYYAPPRYYVPQPISSTPVYW